MNLLAHLLERNHEWAKAIKAGDPGFFERLSHQQNPELLWIGCSDSRVPATQIVNLQPGEVFVHRNIANVVVPDDINCQSVIQYAVEYLKVKHIVVCGHYGCGGIKAAMEKQKYGLMDNWLCHIKDVRKHVADKLDDLPYSEQFDLLCELNAEYQLANVCNSAAVQNAWNSGAELTVHAWIYDIKNGILKSLCARNASGDLALEN